MQRIYSISLSPELYRTQEAHRQVVPETTCPACSQCDSLHRHGTYSRWVTCSLGQVISIIVARFLCLACRCTVSYLPSFALSYRLVNAQTVDAFLQGELQRDDVQRNQENAGLCPSIDCNRWRWAGYGASRAFTGLGLDKKGVWKFDGSHTPAGNRIQNHFIPSIPMSSNPINPMLKTPG